MACVTEQQKKSQEYRDAMKRFDITSDELEVILHKYQNDPKNQEAFSKGELSFPSDEYLQEQLSAPAITVSKESIIDYWNEHYSKPIVFDTLEDATRAEQEARSIVGSTKVRKTASGKYELTVGKPNDYEARISKILKDAPRDKDGHLLAPNGEPTKLTDRQYAQVRTKEFIDWFGDWINDPENASKVVDPVTKEPMVVYHGTPYYNFSSFNIKSEDNKGRTSQGTKKGIYFATDLINAEMFSIPNEVSIARYLERASENDADYYYWGKVQYGLSKKEIDSIFDKIESGYYKNLPISPVYEVFLNIRDIEKIDAEKKALYQLDSDKLKAFNDAKDGVVIYNVLESINPEALSLLGKRFDEHGRHPFTTDYVVFNPNQIKSAEKNIGTFSTTSNNIYEHRSNVQQALGIMDRAEKALLAAKTDQETKAIEARFSSYLAEVLSPEIKVAGGNFGLRNGGNTTNLNLLRDVAELEKPATPEELNTLFITLSRKFAALDGTPKPFRITYGNGLHIVDRGSYYEVQVNNNQLPSYTQLAEEMLHPLVENIQRGNPELFSNFLNEVQTTRDRKLKVIRDGIYRAYSDKSISEQNNELVTQALAYEMKRADQSKLSKRAKAIINAIVKWLVDHNIFKAAPARMKIEHLAYALKFENVKVNLANMLRTYEHRESIPTVETHEGYWTRAEVEKATDKVFLFGDNTEDRTVTHYVPSSTQAVIRGLPNAIGIDTKKDRGTNEGAKNPYPSVTIKEEMDFDSADASGAGLMFAIKAEGKVIGTIPVDATIGYGKITFWGNEHYVDISSVGDASEIYKEYRGKGYGKSAYFEIAKWAIEHNRTLRSAPDSSRSEAAERVWKSLERDGFASKVNDRYVVNNDAIMSSDSSYFTDADFEQFKAQVDDAIQSAINSGKTIVLPEDGIGTGKAQLAERAPKLFAYLQEQLRRLQVGELGATPIQQQTVEQETVEGEESEKLSSRDQAFYDDQRKLSTSIDNLIGIDSVFSNSEIDAAAQDVAFNLSYMITQMQENPSLITEKFGIEIDKEDVSRLSRLDLVKKIGLQNLLDYCRISMFNPLENNAISDEMVDKAFLLLEEENFDTLVLKCNSTFAFIEGWGIKLNEAGKAEVDENVDTSNEDNFNESQNTTEVAETQGNAQEHWQVDTNTLSVISTMSQQIKQFLANCYKLDKEGNQVLSAWGVPQRMNVSEATAQILSWTQGSLNRPQMVKLLTKHANSNPWINQVLERLNDTSGDNAIFQAQFFNSFARHHQSYAVATLENGSYVTKIINTSSALKDAFKNIESAYKVGQHPLFTSKGVNSTTYGKLISINDELSHLKYSEEEKEHIANLLADASIILGYPATKEQILEILDEKSFKAMTSDSLKYIVSLIGANKNNPTWEPFSRDPKKQGILNNIGKFIKPLTDILEATTVHSFYSKGKMYQSDVLPSYLSDMLDSFNKEDKVDENNPAEPTEFARWLNHEFGRYSQFRDASRDKGNLNEDLQRGWRNEWLRLLVTDPKARELLDHKVQLTFNNRSYMLSESDSQAMLDNEYLLSVVTEYFSETNWEKQESLVPAWFRIPMMSNKASAEYIRFYSYRGNGYQDEITKGLKQFFDYELSRIQTVRMRGLNKEQVGYIDQLDENGKHFCFLPFLNKYVENKENSRLGTLIEKKVSGEELTTEEEVELNDLALKAIKYEMNLIAKNKLQQWQRDGIVDAAIKSIKGITKENALEQLENFIWNDMFAAKNILQLTITDIAQYKSAEDLQKRLKELQAPGTKADIFATDFNGDRVSDGINRTLYISDISGEAVKSDLIENLRIVFNNKLALLDPNSRDYAIAKQTYDEILRQYEEDINVTDGQAYSSLSSMRKKMFMFGKWSREAEDFYNKVKAGHWDHTDFQTHFNPLKPFTYSQTSKSTGVKDAPITNFKLGVQNKNSEYMLLIAGAILEEAGQPNILQVLSDVMEDSVKKVSADKCIDSIQFESAVKTGITGVIDITSFINKPNGAEALKTYLEKRIYNDDGTYNALHIHELNYEDFKIQQDIPDHFIDHFQAWGSQIRMITPSDLDVNSSFTYTDGTTQVTKNGVEFRKEYEENAAENIQESLDEVIQEFNLEGTPLERNIALARILQREILSSPRYGMDLLVACSLNENGEFRIPLNDPIQSKRIEQLLNSIIKNRVNKQEIAGGPVVQVTNFGTSRRLHIRFNDKQGNLLKNLEEYQAEGHSEEEWKKYIEENQGGIAYYEVYAPATHRRFFEDFTDENGIIDVKAIEKLNPDLLKMIGYRIPTEDKYSTFPCKIVGFMPSEAGEAIMLPYEITLITGSDFDIDKMYLMLKELPISRKKNVHEEMFKAMQSSRKQWYEKQGKKMPYEESKKLGEQVNDFLSNPLRMSRYGKTDSLYRAMSHWYRNNAFECEIPLSGRSYRNNKVVDMTWSVLTHPDVAAQVLKPGGFDPEKRMGYLAEAMRLGNKYEDIKDLSISKLKKLCTTGKDLTDISTHVQFYKQNSAAGALLAIFATAKIAHATLAGNGYRININEVCVTTQPFYIDGIAFDGLMEFDAQKNRDGSYIGLELGSLVASAADAVKDPVLNLMNINNNTVNILNAMLRMGIPFETAALMLSSKIVGDTLKEYSQIVLDPKKKTSFAKLLKDKFNNLNKQISGKDTSETPSTTKIDSKLDYEDLTKEEMIEAITKNNLNVDYKIILALMRFSSIANSLRTPSAISKLNSINSAVGPLVIDNIIMQNQLTSEMLGLYDSSGNELTMGRIFADHPILEKFYGGYQIAERIFQPISIAASTGFNSAIDGTFGHIVKGNRKLLNNFLEFYKSYMMLVGDVINEDKVSYYINEFPAKLHKAKSDSRYADNKLIQAIKFSSSNSGRVVANIDTTGLQSKDKDLLSGAWIDLYKKDSELATDLFNYCFFKGGIGFNPKAFMGLLPAQLKEQFSSYIETLKRLPSTSEYSHIIRDQFVQHNAKDNSLVPIVEAKNIHTKGNEMILDDKDVASTGYVKTREDGKYKLFKVYERRDSAGNIEKILTELPLLGNNGEFLEISLSPKKSSIGNEGILQIENGSEEQQQGIQDTDVEDIQKDMETEELSSQDMAISQEQASDDAIVAGTLIYNALKPQDKVKIRTLKDIKTNEPERFAAVAEAMRSFFRSKAAELGLKVNDRQIEEMLSMFC